MPRGVKAAGQVPAPAIDESLDVVPTEWTEKAKKTRGRAAKAKAATAGKPRVRRVQATTAAISFKGILADRSKLLKALQIMQDIDEAQVKIECLEDELNKLFN